MIIAIRALQFVKWEPCDLHILYCSDVNVMPFCQLVIGPPGCGKSTYCNGMHQFMSAIGRRCAVVNLDPGNDCVEYPCAVNVAKWLDIQNIMDNFDLGPNGATIFAMDALLEHVDWLTDALSELGSDQYVLIDCPGQVELFTHHSALHGIIQRLVKSGFRIVVVNLVEALHCAEPSKYVSALLLSLQSMLMLELPQVNVLSKIDLLSYQADLPFNLEFYTEVQDLEYLRPLLANDPRLARFAKLNDAIIGLIEDFPMVGFETLCVEDKSSMTRLLHVIDRAGGYAFGSAEGAGDDLFVTAVRHGGEGKIADDQTRWIDFRDHYEDVEREIHDEQSFNGQSNQQAADQAKDPAR